MSETFLTEEAFFQGIDPDENIQTNSIRNTND